MAQAKGLNVKEGKGPLWFEQLEGGNITWKITSGLASSSKLGEKLSRIQKSFREYAQLWTLHRNCIARATRSSNRRWCSLSNVGPVESVKLTLDNLAEDTSSRRHDSYFPSARSSKFLQMLSGECAQLRHLLHLCLCGVWGVRHTKTQKIRVYIIKWWKIVLEWDKLSQNPFLAFYQRWPWLCPEYSVLSIFGNPHSNPNGFIFILQFYFSFSYAVRLFTAYWHTMCDLLLS